jgi:3-dehydroquinate synthase
MSAATIIPVSSGGGYSVHVGRGLVDNLGEVLPPNAAKVLVIHAPAMAVIAERVRDQLAGRVEVLLAEVPDAEGAKRVEVAAFCWQILGQTDFTRTDAIVGLGGGATTDLAGFVAATWLRGVPWVAVPTTVLGAVDAAVGGKTGINTAEGKNLVGAFWAPRAVVADLDLVATLPKNDILAGFAEIVKAGFIADERILELIEADVEVATDPASDVFRELIERAIRVKAEVVSDDFTEQGRRETLNYGHTLGHAIEHAERYRWRHGSAVAIGMIFAAELSRLAAGLPDAVVDRHRAILESLTLPTSYPLGRWKTLLATMQRDKKTRAGMLRFIVLDDVGRPRVLNGTDESLLFSAYQEVGV